MRKVEASITVEAAMIVPLVLFLFGVVMSNGISLYTKVRETALSIQGEDSVDIVEMFYQLERLGDAGEDKD